MTWGAPGARHTCACYRRQESRGPRVNAVKTKLERLSEPRKPVLWASRLDSREPGVPGGTRPGQRRSSCKT